MPVVRLLVIFGLVGLSFACTNSKFKSLRHAGLGDSGKASSAEKEQNADELGTSSEDQEEADADEPVLVTGSFLTCVVDDSVKEDDDASATGIGCTLRSGSEKVSLTGFDLVKWTVLDAFNIEVPVPFVVPSEDSAYSITGVVPTAALQDGKVRLRVEKDGKAEEVFAPVPSITITSGNMTAEDEELPEVSNDVVSNELGGFLLGVSGGRSTLGVMCGAAVATAPFMGASLSIPIYVAGDETVAVTFQGMCGFSLLSYQVSIVRTEGSEVDIVRKTIDTFSTDFPLPGVALQEGHYEVRIEANGNLDKDNSLMVDSVVITHLGSVTVDPPYGATQN